MRLRLVLLALVAMVPLAASAAPGGLLVSGNLDLDGDGQPDVVSVGRDGRVVVATTSGEAGDARLKTEAWRIQKVELAVHPVEGHRVLEVRAEVLGDTNGPSGQEEVLLLEWTDRGLLPLVDELVGPRGRDAEWSARLEVEGGAIQAWQERPGVARCDERVGRLFPRRFDLAGRRFRSVSPTRPAVPAGRVLQASRTAPAGTALPAGRLASFPFDAASTLDGDAGSAENLVPPRELDDGDPATVWSESHGGSGLGEFLTARARAKRARVKALRIVPGDASSPAAFLAANRLKRAVLVTQGGPPWAIEFPADPAGGPRAAGEPWWVTFPQPLSTSCLSVVIDEVYPGRNAAGGGRTALSELAVVTDLDAGGEPALAGLAESVASGGTDASDAEALLATRGTAGARALVAAAARPQRAAAETRRLRLALARLADPAGAEEVARGLAVALASGGAPAPRPLLPGGPVSSTAARMESEGDARRMSDGLKRMGAGAQAALSALLDDEKAPVQARTVAAERLGAIRGEEARGRLSRWLGRGDRGLRRAVTLALGGRAASELSVALETATGTGTGTGGDDAREADAWRVVGLLSRHATDGDARGRAATAVVSRLAGPVDYETRHRLLQVAASLVGETPARAALAAALADGSSPPALRRVALAELVDGMPAGVLPALVEPRLADPDPGVRATAASALSGQTGEATDRPLVSVLEHDRWPFVRRAAVDSLATRCARRPVADALYASVLRDPDDGVRRAALAGLVRCLEPRVGAELVALVSNPSRPTGLRAHAAALLGPLGDRALVDTTVGLLQRTRREAAGHEELARIPAALARSLGLLGEARAARALSQAALDPSSPLVQAAAAESLGRLCPAGVEPVLSRAAQSDDALVVRAARLALARCAGRR